MKHPLTGSGWCCCFRYRREGGAGEVGEQKKRFDRGRSVGRGLFIRSLACRSWRAALFASSFFPSPFVSLSSITNRKHLFPFPVALPQLPVTQKPLKTTLRVRLALRTSSCSVCVCESVSGLRKQHLCVDMFVGSFCSSVNNVNAFVRRAGFAEAAKHRYQHATRRIR